MLYLAGMAVFSGLSLNLLLQFALGTAGTAGDDLYKTGVKIKIPYAQYGILFFSVLFLWIFFNYILPSFWRGFSEFFLFFPLSSIVCMALELLAEKVFPKLLPKIFTSPGCITKTFNSFTAYEGLVPAALMISFAAAANFAGAFVLSFFFALGNMAAMIILNEIRRKSILESVPKFLRGSPLILISMGLLSLVSVSVAGIFFKILEIF